MHNNPDFSFLALYSNKHTKTMTLIINYIALFLLIFTEGIERFENRLWLKRHTFFSLDGIWR